MHCNVFSRYSIRRWMVPQSCSIVQYVVVNNHLVVSYPQRCHTGINVNHLIAIAFYIFSSKNLNSSQKRLIIIVIYNDKQTNLPHKQYYVKTSRCFYRKLYHLFSSAGKTGNMQEFEFVKF